MTEEDKEQARIWYREHKRHVNAMLRVPGPEAAPTGSDASNAALWKPMHWRWFMVGEVAKQIGVKL